MTNTTQAQHTPGPWAIEGEKIRQATSARTESNVIAYGVFPHNARLIAAAPDLLAILERILRCHDTNNNGAYMGEAELCPMFADIARAAIAKAKGLIYITP